MQRVEPSESNQSKGKPAVACAGLLAAECKAAGAEAGARGRHWTGPGQPQWVRSNASHILGTGSSLKWVPGQRSQQYRQEKPGKTQSGLQDVGGDRRAHWCGQGPLSATTCRFLREKSAREKVKGSRADGVGGWGRILTSDSAARLRSGKDSPLAYKGVRPLFPENRRFAAESKQAKMPLHPSHFLTPEMKSASWTSASRPEVACWLYSTLNEK